MEGTEELVLTGTTSWSASSPKAGLFIDTPAGQIDPETNEAQPAVPFPLHSPGPVSTGPLTHCLAVIPLSTLPHITLAIDADDDPSPILVFVGVRSPASTFASTCAAQHPSSSRGCSKEFAY